MALVLVILLNNLNINININMENKSLISSDISYLELLEGAKASIKNNDYKNAYYFVNLLSSLPLLEFNLKLTTLTLASEIYLKLNEPHNSVKLAKRLLRYIREEKNQIDVDSAKLFIEALTNCAFSMIEEEKYFLSSMLFYEIKNLVNDYKPSLDQGLTMRIDDGFTKSLTNISENMKIIQMTILEKRSDLNLIYNYFKNYETNRLKGQSNVYIVSAQWVGNLIPFIKHLIENDTNDIDLDNAFFLNNVCLLFFSNEADDSELKLDIMGSYPGPVNNYVLLDEHLNWNHTQDFSSTFSIKVSKEKVDYYIVNADIYRIIKNIFGVYYDIERKVVGGEVEVNLVKIKTIFISEILRDTKKEAIASKVISISKDCHMKDLEQLFIKRFKDLINKDDGEYDIKIFNYEKKNNDKEIFELIFSFINKDKLFKISAKEYKKENKTISELDIKSDNIIIVEIFPRFVISKPFIRIQSEVIHCSLCNGKVEESKKVSCDLCKQNIYCSDGCKNSDTQHIEYHNKTLSLFKKNYTLEDFTNLSISEFVDKSTSRLGKVGLKNLGNSCFMNSALQCLAHCEVLVKYFLSKMFYDDVNKINKNSTGGLVAKAFYNLIKEIWLNNNEVVIPWEFKQIFVSFAKQFAAGEQQDSHEMLTFLLYKVHEDLNRVSDKSQVAVREKAINESEEETLNRIWYNFNQRENSIITDLFFGLMKSTLKCPDCKHVSINYDLYSSLSLAIPEYSNFSKVKFKVFLNNFKYNFFCIEMGNINKFTNIKELKDTIKEIDEYKNLEFNAILLKNRDFDKVLPDDELIYDYVYTRINFTDEVFIEYQIVFFEVVQNLKNKGDYVTFYVKPSELLDSLSYLIFKNKEPHILTYPKAFSISKKKTLRDLYKEVFRYYRRVLEDLEMSSFETFYDNINDEEYLDKEYLKYTENDKQLFDLYFLNNIPTYNSYIFRDPRCEFCGKSKCGMCKVTLPLETSIHELYVMQQIPRDFVLIADLTKYKDKFYKFYTEFWDPNDPKNQMKSDINIYDCLEWFRREEKLDKNNMWKCPKCDKNKEATKRVEIVNVPRYLILQFKRFKYKGHSSLIEMMNNKKNDAFVDYPINNFNINRFLIGGRKDAVFRLVAATNHTGNIKSGHNFAICRDEENKWIEYNDENVKDLTEVNFTSDTYYMIYEKI
jgi:ubiquitin C-terminal hydrolase